MEQQYKLINRKTKEEHICSKVTIGSYDYYTGEFNIPLESKYKSIEENPRRIVEYHKTLGGFLGKPILCTNSPFVNLPQVIDEVSEQAKINFPLDVSTGTEGAVINGYLTAGFCVGYNKSKETNPFTAEDMIDFGKFCHDDANSVNRVVTFEELFQIWKQQRIKVIYFE